VDGKTEDDDLGGVTALLHLTLVQAHSDIIIFFIIITWKKVPTIFISIIHTLDEIQLHQLHAGELNDLESG
jgi:hypothetical protein